MSIRDPRSARALPPLTEPAGSCYRRRRRRVSALGAAIATVAGLALTACGADPGAGTVSLGALSRTALASDSPADARGTPLVQAGAGPSTRARRAAATTPPLPAHVLLHVPAMSQLPELRNGCEVTSLSMLLTAARAPRDKLALAARMPRDTTPPTFSADPPGLDTVTNWGDPETGFVGDVRAPFGYAIYHRALARLLNDVLPGRGVDLTGAPVDALLRRVARGTPVLMWTTTTFTTTERWVTWQSPHGTVRATPYEHAVLLVGFDQRHLFVNDPLTGLAAQQVDRRDFLAAWDQLGRQALSYN